MPGLILILGLLSRLNVVICYTAALYGSISAVYELRETFVAERLMDNILICDEDEDT